MFSDAGSMPARVAAGIDAALVSTTLGVMYALIAYADLGPAALPTALLAALTALMVGALAALAIGQRPLMLSGPTASGTLVVAALVRDLQMQPGARGSLEAALFAVFAVVLAAGLLQMLFARLRIGVALKFVPFPVLVGFANTVALSLVVSMLPAALGHDFPGRLAELTRWGAGWLPGATVVAVASTMAGLATARWMPRAPAAFVALLAGAAVHYALAATAGAGALGPTLPLGPVALPPLPDFQALLGAPTLGVGYWAAIGQSALVLAVLNSLFSLLTCARLAAATDPPLDGNLQLHTQGLGNIAAAFLGGLPLAASGPPTVPLRAAPGSPALSVGVYLVLLAAIFTGGHGLLTMLPMAAVAGAVFVAARSLFDPTTPLLLRRAFRGSGARFDAWAPLLVGGLVVCVGLLQGLAAALFVGALTTACLLAVELRRSVVLSVSDAGTRRSRRVRSADDARRLDELGAAIRVVELGHWLYFGTSDELGEALDTQEGTLRWLLLDAQRVDGVDITAARSLVQAAQRLRTRGVRLVLAGFAAGGDARRRSFDLWISAADDTLLEIVGDIDEALERAEDDLLAGMDTSPDSSSIPFALPCVDDAQAARLLECFVAVTLPAGATLFRRGDSGDALYAVRHGRMALRIERGGAAPLRLLSFGPGVIFGEMALLDGRPRSADAVAEIDTELITLSREQFDALAGTEPVLHAAALRGIALHLASRLRETTVLLGATP
ncbi:MAG: SulP family inorganic anion transporter [Burkholderiaceae bacterium]